MSASAARQGWAPVPARRGRSLNRSFRCGGLDPGFANMSSTTIEIECMEGELELGPLELHYGGRLDRVTLGWRLCGPSAAPLVVALGGISAHRRVYCTTEHAAGWWKEIVGPNLALPAERFRILSFDYLGGSGATTGPKAGERFPSISTHDQATLLERLLNALGLPRIDALIGASYGGMVGLAFAARFPARVARLIVISAAHRTHPMATAWRSVQRRIVELALEQGDSTRGMALARALAMATYRSPREFAARFADEPRRESGRFVFPVEDYLLARGEAYAGRYAPESFLALSESIDLHRIEPEDVSVPVLAVAIIEDQLVPLDDMRELAARLPNAELLEWASHYGHDAFLKETHQLRALFARLAE